MARSSARRAPAPVTDCPSNIYLYISNADPLVACRPQTHAHSPTLILPCALSDWATGYTPNTSYLKDPRTDPAITSLLDGGGFVGVRRSQQLKGDGLEHIFAGGDLCSLDAFSHGERTAAMAVNHAAAIAQNILLLAGRREGKLKQAIVNENPGLNALAVSLGKGNGLLYACDPNLASFFASGEALKAEVGEMGPAGTAGKAGWKELSPSVEFLKFTMWPEGFKKMLFDDDMTIFDQFIAPAIQDMP